jgi:nickel transport protein
MKISTKIIALVLIVSFSALSFAHKMNVDAYVASGSKIKGSAAYHKTPIVNAKVKALAPDGKVLAETKTDEKGNFSFKVDVRCDLKVVVIDGGHKGSTAIPAEDLPESLPAYKGK